jgi:hypothetical protein
MNADYGLALGKALELAFCQNRSAPTSQFANQGLAISCIRGDGLTFFYRLLDDSLRLAPR